MKSAIFWDMTPCIILKVSAFLVHCSAISILKMEAIFFQKRGLIFTELHGVISPEYYIVLYSNIRNKLTTGDCQMICQPDS
jgi:hypothetical protein